MTAMAKPKRQSQGHANLPPNLSLVPDRPCFIPPPTLRAQTEPQRRLISSLRNNTLTIATGPAGVGKTYVALSVAADMLQNHTVDRLVITRPLMGVDDEDIGALPGDLETRLAPWCLPMLDVLEERLGSTFVTYLLKTDRIRISPLAMMRGSSFKNAFVFVTEAQNLSVAQTKMFLTRVGTDSKVCVDGDPLQSDRRNMNGLQDAITRLIDLNNVGIVEFTREDVVRSAFCRSVLDRYE
jgi:phosphate starvation-inducible protein PhoH and related proteins